MKHQILELYISECNKKCATVSFEIYLFKVMYFIVFHHFNVFYCITVWHLH